MTRLTPKLLLGAYASGIFPMAESRHDRGLFWVDPDVRGVLPFEAFHIPRRLRRTLRRRPYQIRCDVAFDDVLVGCAEVTSDRPETWINQEIEGLYQQAQHNQLEITRSLQVESWGAKGFNLRDPSGNELHLEQGN